MCSSAYLLSDVYGRNLGPLNDLRNRFFTIVKRTNQERIDVKTIKSRREIYTGDKHNCNMYSSKVVTNSKMIVSGVKIKLNHCDLAVTDRPLNKYLIHIQLNIPT